MKTSVKIAALSTSFALLCGTAGGAYANPVNDFMTLKEAQLSQQAIAEGWDFVAARAAFDKILEEQGLLEVVEQARAEARAAQQDRWKTAAAKVAIKGAIKALKQIGKKAWNDTVKKIPIKEVAKKYLTYEVLLKSLNVALDFEGKIEDAITSGLESVGVPSYLAGVCARAVVTFLL